MTRTALLIAPDSNGDQLVFGIPNVRRLVKLVSGSGFGNIHLLGRIESFVPLLSDLLPPHHFHPAQDLDQTNQGLQQLVVEKGERVLVLRADLVIDRSSFKEFLQTDDNADILHMGLAGNGAAAGIYLVRPTDIAPITELLWSPADATAPFPDRTSHIRGHNGLPRNIGQGADSTRASEQQLIASLAAQTAKTDGFMSRHVDRRISQAISKRLAHTRLTPNQVTLMGVSVGLTGALLLSFPGYWARLVGSLLFLFCIIVDGVDGEIARLKLMESRFGHYLDITTDNLVHVAVFVGIGYGQYNATGNSLYIWALWALLGGFLVCVLAVYQCILCVDEAALQQSPRVLRLMEMVTNRDFAYLVAFLALVGRLHWFVIGASVGTYAFAAGLWFLTWREQQKRAMLQQPQRL